MFVEAVLWIVRTGSPQRDLAPFLILTEATWMTKVKTTLVIGGTGMLQDATQWLIERSRKTLLVSRKASRFEANNANVIAIDADWNDSSFLPKVRSGIEKAGSISDALFWIHDPEPVLTWLLPLLPGARVVVVLGSMDVRPKLIEAAANVATVRLGSIATADGRRWLTNAEISAGVIEALLSGKSNIVGELAAIR
jgi:hypothetical protein